MSFNSALFKIIKHNIIIKQIPVMVPKNLMGLIFLEFFAKP